MHHIAHSLRYMNIEKKWHLPVKELFYQWHWQENLKHSEIGLRVGLSRPTITRWFHELDIPRQSCTRFTNLNLKRWLPAKPKPKKIFPRRVNQEFFQKWSEEMAYVLGFIIADGAVFTNPRGSQYIAMYSTDREIIEKIRYTMSSNHRIGERVRKNNHHKNLFVFQIGSKRFVGQLKKFGIVQNKSLVIRLPKIPENYFRHFVRGYFDGDGCIYFGKHKSKDRKNPRRILSTRFSSGSKQFLEDLKKRLQRYTASGGIYKKGTSWDLYYTHRDSRRLFQLFYGQMKTNLYLSRKYVKYQAVMAHGPVAQSARAPACHAGGYGFEPRPVRQK